MSNVLLTPTKILRRTLFHYMNELQFGSNVYKEYVGEYNPGNGPTLTYRKPNRFRAHSGRDVTSSIAEVKESSSTITLNDQENVAWAFNADDLTLTIEEYEDRYIKPSVVALTDYTDRQLALLYKSVFNQVGTPGTDPNDFLTFRQAQQRLTEEATPDSDRVCCVNGAAATAIQNNLKGLLHQPIVGEIIEKGYMGKIAGARFLESNNVSRHTVGTYDPAGAAQKDGASNEGDTTLLLKSFGNAKTITAGDIFTIAAVNAVNPVNGQAYTRLQQFVATALATSGVGGDVTITVNPTPIYSASAGATTFLPYQNVDVLPQGNAAFTRSGTLSTSYAINMMFHKWAFAMVTVPLAMPDGVSFKAQQNFGGVSLRIIKDYDILLDREVCRVDIWAGFKAQFPEFACRIIGA